MGSIGDRYLYNESIERGLWSFETSLKKLIAPNVISDADKTAAIGIRNLTSMLKSA
jgi:hypothetical protein